MYYVHNVKYEIHINKQFDKVLAVFAVTLFFRSLEEVADSGPTYQHHEVGASPATVLPQLLHEDGNESWKCTNVHAYCYGSA